MALDALRAPEYLVCRPPALNLVDWEILRQHFQPSTSSLRTFFSVVVLISAEQTSARLSKCNT